MTTGANKGETTLTCSCAVTRQRKIKHLSHSGSIRNIIKHTRASYVTFNKLFLFTKIITTVRTASRILAESTPFRTIKPCACDSPNRPTYGMLLNLFTYLLRQPTAVTRRRKTARSNLIGEDAYILAERIRRTDISTRQTDLARRARRQLALLENQSQQRKQRMTTNITHTHTVFTCTYITAH